MAQRLKRLPAMWETWVRSLGREDPLEKELQPTLVFFPGESHGWRRLVGYSPWGRRVGHDWVTSLSLSKRSFIFWLIISCTGAYAIYLAYFVYSLILQAICGYDLCLRPLCIIPEVSTLLWIKSIYFVQWYANYYLLRH